MKTENDLITKLDSTVDDSMIERLFYQGIEEFIKPADDMGSEDENFVLKLNGLKQSLKIYKNFFLTLYKHGYVQGVANGASVVNDLWHERLQEWERE
jgi:hypothetical protein